MIVGCLIGRYSLQSICTLFIVRWDIVSINIVQDEKYAPPKWLTYAYPALLGAYCWGRRQTTRPITNGYM